MKSLVMLLIVFILMYIIRIIHANQSTTAELVRCHPLLNVTDDGPVTLDVTVTIYASLTCADESAQYLYVFEDDDQRKTEVLQHNNASTTFIFSKGLGVRTVEVTVYVLHPTRVKIAFGETSFQVTEFISGTLHLSGIVTDDKGNSYIATGQDTNISLHLHFPPQVLMNSEFAYSWTIDDLHFTTDFPHKVHRFPDPGLKHIRVAAVGRVPSYGGTSRFKWGYIDLDVNVKTPFSNINISGNTYLEHGQLLNLDISCEGSAPVQYCWKVLPFTENSTNLTCSHPVIGRDCSFPILYYFRDSGDYELLIYVSNVITSMQRNVQVHIYDVSLRPQLSTVLIPLVCTVLVVLILAVAVVLHMRRNTHYDVETADFDFMHMEEQNTALAIETPWEIMRRSLLHNLQVHFLCSSSQGLATSSSYGSIFVPREASSK